MRGAALTELVLVVPLLGALALFALYFAELSRARLELLQLTRWAGFELTRHPLDDAEQVAAAAATSRARALVRGGELRAVAFVAGQADLDLTISEQPLAVPRLGAHGQLRVEARVRFDSRLTPLHLRSQSLRSAVELLASGGHLRDGSNAAGERHPLWRRVDALTLKLEPVPVRGPFTFNFPAATTFVVSKNYGTGGPHGECEHDPSHPAPEGLNAVEAIDWPYRRCYETAPLRDQSAYQRSLQVQQLGARGPYFMGCQDPEPDDPTTCRGDIR